METIMVRCLSYIYFEFLKYIPSAKNCIDKLTHIGDIEKIVTCTIQRNKIFNMDK